MALEINSQLLNSVQENVTSEFDNLLQNCWNNAKQKHVFKYILESYVEKQCLKGKYNFYKVLSLERALLRRKPQKFSSLNVIPDPDEFNFTNIKDSEILFQVYLRIGDDRLVNSTIIVNNAPIEYCNSLLVTELDKRLPQQCTFNSLYSAICIIAASGNKGLRLGFNSIGANASVNHCHWHLYYMRESLQIEHLPIINNELLNWYLPCIAFEIDSKLEKLLTQTCKKVITFLNYVINELKISYNLFLTRSTNFQFIRLFIWLRKPNFEAKNDFNISPAICEFSGFFICKSVETFEKLEEKDFIDIMKSSNIDKNEYLDALKFLHQN